MTEATLLQSIIGIVVLAVVVALYTARQIRADRQAAIKAEVAEMQLKHEALRLEFQQIEDTHRIEVLENEVRTLNRALKQHQA